MCSIRSKPSRTVAGACQWMSLRVAGWKGACDVLEGRRSMRGNVHTDAGRDYGFSVEGRIGNDFMHRKVSVIGGGGVRTPLLIHGLLQAQSLLKVAELQLFDVDSRRAELMASLGRETAKHLGVEIKLLAVNSAERAVEGCDFVLSSLRVGGMAARARDERIAIEEGLAGQETTGPGGVAMAVRTGQVALANARMVAQLAPKAWFINFTNPAGLITQALNHHTKLKLVCICDTPAELLHRIAHVLGA